VAYMERQACLGRCTWSIRARLGAAAADKDGCDVEKNGTKDSHSNSLKVHLNFL